MNSDFSDLLSGKRRGSAALLLRLALRLAALFYGLGIRTRNMAYNRGWKKVERAALPVISLGNLTTGGTGKTPLAAFVARWLRERSVRVCFLSRGYGSSAGGTNDEALVLDQLCPDVPHLQNADRVAAARVAQEELDSQLLILDDGFQHRRLARDLDIVLIDATCPWGYGHLLPRGLLREPASSLKRAALVVITRVDQTARENIEVIRRQIANHHPDCDIAEAAFLPARLINSAGGTDPLDALAGQSVAAFCGIGNPTSFRTMLERCGCQIADFQSFPDHHNYTRADVEELERWVRAHPVTSIVCTQKDLVKIGVESLGNRPLWALEISMQIVAGAAELEARLAEVARKVRPASVPE